MTSKRTVSRTYKPDKPCLTIDELMTTQRFAFAAQRPSDALALGRSDGPARLLTCSAGLWLTPRGRERVTTSVVGVVLIVEPTLLQPHGGIQVAKNPENLEAPNKSEQKPPVRPNVAKDLGSTAVRATLRGK
jgi:hypothetical protein